MRQSIRVYAGGLPAPFFQPRYDLLSLELAFDFTSALEGKTLYRVELLDGVTEGTRLSAFDGAPLAEEDRREPWRFTTSSRIEPSLDAPAPAREATCEEIAERLRASCGSGACHGGEEPVMGLSFEGTDALKRTALDRVARETDTGTETGIPLVDPSRFGVAMPIIARGAAHDSYLVYKLLLAPENLASCVGSGCERFSELPGADACRAPSAEERQRLADWFVLGRPMPPPREPGEMDALPPSHHLDCGFMRALVRWIDAGAPCD